MVGRSVTVQESSGLLQKLFAKFLKDPEKMSIRPFLLERYFAKYEFHTPFLLSSSDCEALTLEELLGFGDDRDRRQWQELKLGYTESPGHPVLREWIARMYQGLSATEVVTAVPEEAIYLTMRTLLKAGDKVVVSFPGYQSLYEIAASMGCEVLRWIPVETSDGWRFEVDRLRELVGAGVKAVVLNFPHNPTGTQPAAKEWAEMMEVVQASGAWLISDEMYRGLEDGADALAPAVDFPGRMITIAGLSKAYGLAGLRCGWVACRDQRVLDQIQHYKDYTTICASAPSEQLSILAMKHGPALRERCRAIVAHNRPLLEAFMTRHTRLFAARPAIAGPVCFPRWLGGSASAFCEKAAAEAGVMLLPATVYESGDAHVRMGMGRLTFPAALEQLDQYLREHGEELE